MGGTSAAILGAIIGLAVGVWWTKRVLKKSQDDIPEDILNKIKQKEVKNGRKKESNKKESRKGFFRFFRRKSRDKGEPRGFALRDRSTEAGEPNIDRSELDSGTTDAIGEQPSIPIQSSIEPKGTKPKLRKNKQDSKKHWPSFN